MPELALFGGSKAKRKPFPLWPQYDDRERRALEEVLESRAEFAHCGRIRIWSQAFVGSARREPETHRSRTPTGIE